MRMDLFGDVLDDARRFDPETQRTTDRVRSVELAPVSEVILDEPAIARFRQNYRVHFGAARGDDPLYESVSNGRKHAGVEHWLGFFHDHLETLFDYLPDAPVMLDHQLTPARIARWEAIADSYESRLRAGKGATGGAYHPAPPELLYLDDDAWEAAVASHRVLALHPGRPGAGPRRDRRGRARGARLRARAPERGPEPLRRARRSRPRQGRGRPRGPRHLLRRLARAAPGAPGGRGRGGRPSGARRARGRPRREPRRLGDRARLRGAVAHGDRRAGRAGRPAHPARQAPPPLGRLHRRGAVAQPRRSRRARRSRGGTLPGAGGAGGAGREPRDAPHRVRRRGAPLPAGGERRAPEPLRPRGGPVSTASAAAPGRPRRRASRSASARSPTG